MKSKYAFLTPALSYPDMTASFTSGRDENISMNPLMS